MLNGIVVACLPDQAGNIATVFSGFALGLAGIIETGLGGRLNINVEL